MSEDDAGRIMGRLDALDDKVDRLGESVAAARALEVPMADRVSALEIRLERVEARLWALVLAGSTAGGVAGSVVGSLL